MYNVSVVDLMQDFRIMLVRVPNEKLANVEVAKSNANKNNMKVKKSSKDQTRPRGYKTFSCSAQL